MIKQLRRLARTAKAKPPSPAPAVKPGPAPGMAAIDAAQTAQGVIPAAPASPRKAQQTVPGSGPRIGLALGGGGARGLAHIVLLEAIDELGLRPSVIAGTSIGAIFGAAYASGLTALEIRARAEEMLSRRIEIVERLFSGRRERSLRLWNLRPLRSALLRPETLLEMILPDFATTDFSDLLIPTKVVATDFYAQKPVVLTAGPLLPAVAASMALPGVFMPVMMGDRAMMDGGLVNPLPFDLLTGEADLTIAFDVSGAPYRRGDRAHPSALEAIFASSQILEHTIVQEKLKSGPPDIYIDVDLDRFRVLEFHKIKEILDAATPVKDVLKRGIARHLELT